MKKNTQFKKAFTMIELIFVIVIIGVLSSFAIPKFRGLTSGAKVSAEISTMSSVVTALESINGEWSINEGSFTWGVGNNRSTDATFNNATGYPINLSIAHTFDRVIKDNSNKYTNQFNSGTFSIFTGPASNPTNGVTSPTDKANSPDHNDFWVYAYGVTQNGCTVNGIRVYPGDFVLIDVAGAGATVYAGITCN